MPATTTIVINAKNLTPQAFNQLKNDVNGTVKAFNEANKSTAQFEQTTGKLSKGIIGVGGAIAGLGMAKLGSDIFNASLKMENMDKMLIATEGSAEKGKKTLAEYIKMAKDPGLALPQITQSMTVFKQLGLNAEFAKKLLRETSNELVLMGKGVPELERVNRQFEQMIGKGKPMREDLMIIAESLPNISKLVKDAFGTFDTEKLIKQGMTSEKFLEGLVAQMEKAPRAIGGTQNSLDNFKDSLMQFEAALGKDILPQIGKLLDYLTKLMDGFKELPEGVKAALGTGTIGVLGGVGLLGLAGTISFLVNQIGMATKGLGALGAVNVANAGAQAGVSAVASTAESRIAAAVARQKAIDEGTYSATYGLMANKTATPNAFMAGSTALQIATATIAAGTIVFAGYEIYKAFKRDFTAEEKKENREAGINKQREILEHLKQVQLGAGNFPNMTFGEMPATGATTKDNLRVWFEALGMTFEYWQDKTLENLKQALMLPTDTGKEFGPQQPAKNKLPSALPDMPDFLKPGAIKDVRGTYREVAKPQAEMWMDNVESMKPTFGEIGGGLPVPNFNGDFLEYMKSEAAKASILAMLENQTPENLGGTRGYREGINLSGITGFGVGDDIVKRKQIEIDIAQQALDEYKAGYGELSEGISQGARDSLKAWKELTDTIQIDMMSTLSLINQSFNLLEPIFEKMGMSKGTSSTISNVLSGAMSGFMLGSKIYPAGGGVIGAALGGFSGLMKGVSFDSPENDYFAYQSGAKSAISMSKKSADDFSREFGKGFSKGTSSNQDSGLGEKLDKLIGLMENTKYEFYLDSDPISAKVRKKIEQKKARGEWA